MYIRAKDLRKNPFSTCESTSNQQKLSNIHICPPAILQASGKALSKAKPSKATFEEKTTQFKRRLRDRCYPDNLIENTLSDIKFSERMSALQNKQKTRKRILPFVAEYGPSVPNLKNILMSKWHLIENQLLLK